MSTDIGSKTIAQPAVAPVTPRPAAPAEPVEAVGSSGASVPVDGAVPVAALQLTKGERRGPVEAAPAPAVPAARPPLRVLVPGSQFAGSRYRLLERCGGSAEVSFWRAHDSTLARDVALTVAEIPSGGAGTAEDFFGRSGWLGRVRSDAAAAVLDMFEFEGRAVVVAQWKQSHELGRVRAGRPADAAAAVVPLAVAARDAHRSGAVMAIDHPSRIRVDADGVAYLAFPGVPADTTRRGDVRGLGNVLCELLTGMHHTGDGHPLAPSAVRPDVPADLSDLVVRAVGAEDVTADRMVDVLGRAVASAQSPAADVPAPVAAAPADEPESTRAPWPTWAPYLAGGVLLAVLATIGWFVGVSLI